MFLSITVLGIGKKCLSEVNMQLSSCNNNKFQQKSSFIPKLTVLLHLVKSSNGFKEAHFTGDQTGSYAVMISIPDTNVSCNFTFIRSLLRMSYWVFSGITLSIL